MKKKTSKYRSGLEEKVANLLESLGVTYEYESKRVPYTIQHNYCPDFVLPNHVHLETKGYWDAADRRKIKAVKKDNPEFGQWIEERAEAALLKLFEQWRNESGSGS